jgi:hypothetical protein
VTLDTGLLRKIPVAHRTPAVIPGLLASLVGSSLLVRSGFTGPDWPVTGVKLLVLIQVLRLPETLATLLTLEWLLTGVN